MIDKPLTEFRSGGRPGFSSTVSGDLGPRIHCQLRSLDGSDLDGQRNYHRYVAAKHHALQRRVHLVNYWLFGLTPAGALLHLLIHSLWLSLVTTFFPVLGASLHGALAQSESYRLAATSERLVAELGHVMENIRQSAREADPAVSTAALRAAVESAVALILDEHQDWHMLVRPHHLPLG
jgi:hypothetical protein